MSYRDARNVRPVDRDLLLANARRLAREAEREAAANSPMWLFVIGVVGLLSTLAVVQLLRTP